MTLIIVTVPPLSMMISIVTIVVAVPTDTRIGFDERFKKHPHPCWKRRHTGSEIGFDGRPRCRIFEKLGELALNLIALPFTDQEIAQPVKRLDDAHRRSPGPELLAAVGRKVIVTLPSLMARRRASVCTTIFGRDGVSHAQIVRRSHAVDKHPGLVASSDGIDNRARIGRVGFLGELVEARLIVEPAIDPLEGFGLRQPLQRLIDGVPRGEIDEITGQTLRGASARIEHGCFQVGRGAYSCPKIVALFGQLPKSSVRNTYTNFGQCVCQARNRLVGESRILHLKPKRNSRVICAPSRALPRRARPRGSGKTLG